MRTNWGESMELERKMVQSWEKQNTVYFVTLQKIPMGNARFGVRINQIKSTKAHTTMARRSHSLPGWSRVNERPFLGGGGAVSRARDTVSLTPFAAMASPVCVKYGPCRKVGLRTNHLHVNWNEENTTMGQIYDFWLSPLLSSNFKTYDFFRIPPFSFNISTTNITTITSTQRILPVRQSHQPRPTS
jgi:hypothetical protein